MLLTHYNFIIYYYYIHVFILGPCFAGFYCTIGAYINTPNDNETTGAICPQHHICPTGSIVPKKCPAGYFANFTGMSSCELCLGGFLCIPGEAPRACPRGMSYIKGV